MPMFRHALIAAAGLLVSGVCAAALPGPVVTPQWLAQHAHDPNLVVLDLRAPKDYAQGHIPGAVSAPYPSWRSTINHVNRMLPPVPVIQAFLRSAGVNPQSEVVIYNALNTPMALGLGAETRAFWTLKVLGHGSEAILQGGYEGWRAAKQPVTTAAYRPRPGRFVAHFQPQVDASLARVRADLHRHNAVLVDDRPMQQIVGAAKAPFVARFGHIPGARPYPATWMVNPQGDLLPRAQLASLARMAGLPANRNAHLITYCNTGHWASIGWFVATQLLGYHHVRLYDGSMADWAAHPKDPVAVGFVR